MVIGYVDRKVEIKSSFGSLCRLRSFAGGFRAGFSMGLIDNAGILITSTPQPL